MEFPLLSMTPRRARAYCAHQRRTRWPASRHHTTPRVKTQRFTDDLVQGEQMIQLFRGRCIRFDCEELLAELPLELGVLGELPYD